MNIHSLHIYGFGKWENYSLDFSKNLTVIFGANEAGKTTIMSFLHFVLFGFSSKVEEEKYRSKTIHAYGGQVTISFDEVSKIIVERIKTDTKEKLTIKDSNGKEISRDTYRQWIKNMDQSYFESIFSFNQLSLQKISQLKGEDLNKYLFSSSVIGSDQLYKVEKMIDKEMDELFKKKGKNQKIAKLLSELTTYYEKQKEYKQNLDQYSQDVLKVEDITAKITNVEKEIDSLLQQLHSKKQLVELKEVIIEVQELEQQLKEMSSLAITEEEMLLFQQLKTQLVTLERELDELTIEIVANKEKLEKLRTNQLSPKQLQELDELLQLGKIYEDKQKEQSIALNQLQNLDQQLEELTIQEGFSFLNEQVIQMNSSSLLKEEISKMLKETNIIDSNLKQTKEELDHLKIAIVKKEEVLASIQAQLLPEEERGILQILLENQQLVKEQEGKKQFILEQLEKKQATYKSEIKNRKRKKQLQNKLGITFLFIGLVLLILSLFFIKQTWLTMSSILLVVIGFVFLFIKRNSKQLDLLKADIEYLEQSLTNYQPHSFIHEEVITAKRQLEIQSDLWGNYQLEKSKLDDLFERLDRLDNQFLKWQDELLLLQQKKKEILNEWQLVDSFEMNQVPIIFDLIVTYKSIYLEKKKIQESYNDQDRWLKEVENKLELFASIFSIDIPRDKNFLLVELNRKRLEVIQEQSMFNEKTQLLEKLELTYKQKLASKEIIYQKLEELMISKSLNNVEDFYVAYEKSKEKKEKELRLAHLKLTLKSTNINQQLMNQYVENPFDEWELEKLENHVENTKLIKNQLLEEKISLANEIRILEEGKSIETITQNYEILKAEYEKTIEKWLELAIAKKKLQRTIRFYMEEKLPHILKVANQHFQYLTNDNYTDILFNEQSQFYVKHQTGEFYTIHQLSQSTKEQVYISLRIALANNIFENDYFPLIIDDGFVHFDEQRTKNILNLLQNLSDHQVILFTCHKHLLNQLSKNKIITIA